MIEQIRKRFIRVSMLTFSLVLLLVLIVINGLNYQQTVQRLDQTNTMLLNNNGHLPEENRQAPENSLDQPPMEFEGDPEMRLATRFFSIELDSDGQVLQSDLSHIATVDLTSATSLAHADQYKVKGWHQNFRFSRQATENGSLFTYVEANREINSLRNIVFITIGVFFSCLLVVYCLLRSFSHLAIRPLLQNIERQKEFISNASHELKTPLAVLSANNDVLELTGQENEWTRSNKRQISRLTHLIDQMLLLARFDEGKFQIQPTQVQLRSCIEEIQNNLQPLLDSSHKKIVLHISETKQVVKDPTYLKQLLTLIIENAIKYSTEETITIKELNEKPYQIGICNACVEMTEEECHQLFDRFYRRDQARNRQQGGSGMGLSIAKALAKINQITLQAQLLNPTLLQFTLTLEEYR